MKYLKNSEIDKDKWNECIAEAPNGLIYARTFYLDNIARGWTALVGENYEWVLPLIDKKKYGISYLYQPPFTQQLGVFSKTDAKVPFKEIIEYLKKHYSFWEVSWNYELDTSLINSSVQVTGATNFVLDVKNGYENIAENYHKDLKKNLKRNKRFQLVYQQTTDYKKCIELYRQFYGNRMPHVKETDHQNFICLCDHANENKMLICREVVNTNNELMAAALILYDGKRLYNLINITTEAGRKEEANHFLLDAIIKEFSGSPLLFDFEGSDLPGVKNFYANFGAVDQRYFMLKYNALPWPLRLFKS